MDWSRFKPGGAYRAPWVELLHKHPDYAAGLLKLQSSRIKSEMDRLGTQHERALSAKKSQMDQLRAQMNRESSVHKSKMDQLVAKHERELSAQKAKMDQLVAHHKQEVSTQKSQMDQLVAQVFGESSAQKSQMELLVVEHKREMSAQKSQMDQLVGQYNQRERETQAKMKLERQKPCAAYEEALEYLGADASSTDEEISKQATTMCRSSLNRETVRRHHETIRLHRRSNWSMLGPYGPY